MQSDVLPVKLWRRKFFYGSRIADYFNAGIFHAAAVDTGVTLLAEFVWPVRVYYEDTDCGGVVYYANYLKFMERARTERLRAMGFEQDELRDQQNILFTVHSAQIDFKRPAKFNDLLEVTAVISRQRRASITFTQEIRRAGESAVLCMGHVNIACVNACSFKPAPIPEFIRSELTNVC